MRAAQSTNTDLPVVVRIAEAFDAPAIRIVHERAFGDRPNEADLAESLTKVGKATISLVPIKEGQIIGHIFFSPVTLKANAPDLRAVGLDPLAVLPGCQRWGGDRSPTHLLKISDRDGRIQIGHRIPT